VHAFEIVLVVAWVWTLATTILNVWFVPRLGRRSQIVDLRLVSIVITARNQERTIGATVRAMLAQTYANLEVIVVNDRSTDRTAEILAEIGDPRLVVIDGEEPPPDWLGKPWACDQGCRAARGELLLIVDADVQYGPDALAAMVAYMNEHGEIAMLAVLPRFDLHGFWENVAMPMLAVTAFMFIPSWFANRTTIAAFGIGGGTGNFVRRRDFDEIGGYASLHAAVVDDVGMARQLRAHGKRTHVVRADEFISLRMYQGAREIIEGFTKNLFTAFGGFAGVCTLLPMMLLFHFVPYLLLLRGDALAIVTVILISLSRLILFRSIGARLDNALLGHPVMIAFWTWIFIRSTWLTGVRKQVQWRGRTYERTWTRFGARR
jgi:glycosyltransferase involved in cell wall biosynthesis